MIKWLGALAVVALLATPASAGWKKSGGIVSCSTSTCVGNPDSPGCGQTVDEEESSHGHLGNKPQHQEECKGPGKGGSTAQCP